MSIPLCLKLHDWPLTDRVRWCNADQLTSFLSGPQPVRKWSPKFRRIVMQGYGQYLSCLLRHGLLDADQAPEDRVSPERIAMFVDELQGRVSSWSVAMMVEGCLRMLVVMAPDRDWSWLRTIVSKLKTIAKGERDKRAHMVDARQLLALGISLMDDALEAGEGYFAATAMRDGLIIALLSCCPIRIANLSAIQIGKHLLFDRDRYRLFFTEEETKTSHPYQAELPPSLTPYVDAYLRIHRRTLLARGEGVTTERLWIDRSGGPMSEGAIRTQIEKRTEAAFGRHVWPHLFRSIAATSFVDHDPEKVRLVPDLLGHSDANTAHKHYILANAAIAHEDVQSALMRRRIEAMERLKASRRSS